ncbi:TPA: hypothetical protein MB374_003045 [Klebsiella pneumoniae]|nr:hypothetical protein KU669_10705 [Klebsiella pneumoniae]HBT4924930.1 hypothetical protein [Klebsiella pneumoniae]
MSWDEQLPKNAPSTTLRDAYNGDYVQGIAVRTKAFFGKIEALALLNAINAST